MKLIVQNHHKSHSTLPPAISYSDLGRVIIALRAHELLLQKARFSQDRKSRELWAVCKPAVARFAEFYALFLLLLLLLACHMHRRFMFAIWFSDPFSIPVPVSNRSCWVAGDMVVVGFFSATRETCTCNACLYVCWTIYSTPESSVCECVYAGGGVPYFFLVVVFLIPFCVLCTDSGGTFKSWENRTIVLVCVFAHWLTILYWYSIANRTPPNLELFSYTMEKFIHEFFHDAFPCWTGPESTNWKRVCIKYQ